MGCLVNSNERVETMSDIKCPECNSTMILLGEGGYGVCANDQCKIKRKLASCDIPDCDEVFSSQEKEDKHEMKD